MNPAEASARAVDAWTEVALPGLPLTDVDRVEASILADVRDDRLVELLISELGQIGPWSWQHAYDTGAGRRWLAERLIDRMRSRLGVAP